MARGALPVALTPVRPSLLPLLSSGSAPQCGGDAAAPAHFQILRELGAELSISCA